MWFRRDLRLADHPALTHAVAQGRPVIPVFLYDDVAQEQGAASRMRLGMSVASLSADLAALGSRLILRRGNALENLRALIRETGAGAVVWSRLYDPISKARDIDVKSALKMDGIEATSFVGHLLFEPWTVETKTGGFYRVYSPMYKSIKDRDVPDALSAPTRIPAPGVWPDSDVLVAWQMGADMRRGHDIVAQYCVVGERAAYDRLDRFIARAVDGYKENRDFPSRPATSGLSENMTYGEISPRVMWHAGQRARRAGAAGAEHFVKEVVWREFAYHLVHHTPHIMTQSWRDGWDNFAWSTDASEPKFVAWKQGRTGIAFVDAAMRELYVTGIMHNRSRMIVASYLTKHLMTHWKLGHAWFDDCLIDWDPASNAMGWQWAAGCGPDASPYFRVFNPVTQLDKFDADRAYASRWIAEGYNNPHDDALSFFNAVPKTWGLNPSDPYPKPIVAADVGRKIALAAYANRSF
jgi:deoxyribodipyrimidine photo-lyase